MLVRCDRLDGLPKPLSHFPVRFVRFDLAVDQTQLVLITDLVRESHDVHKGLFFEDENFVPLDLNDISVV